MERRGGRSPDRGRKGPAVEPEPPADPFDTADRLHSAAIHLLRRLRAEDRATGLSASRLSALSVVVFGGPLTLGELAAAEQVRAPTISRLVREMEKDGLVRRLPDPKDRRVHRVVATGEGRGILLEGRRRRVAVLAEELAGLPPQERALLREAARLLERLALPSEHPVQEGEG